MLAQSATHEELTRRVIGPVLTRWRCLLDRADARPATKDVVRVALAAVLGRYGFQDTAVPVPV